MRKIPRCLTVFGTSSPRQWHHTFCIGVERTSPCLMKILKEHKLGGQNVFQTIDVICPFLWKRKFIERGTSTKRLTSFRCFRVILWDLGSRLSDYGTYLHLQIISIALFAFTIVTFNLGQSKEMNIHTYIYTYCLPYNAGLACLDHKLFSHF